MIKKLKKLLLVSAICCLCPALALADAAIKIMPNTKYTAKALPDSKIIELVKQNVNLTPEANIFQARVQTIFNPKTQQPEYLLVYSLSSKSYSYTITQIKLNASYQKTTVTPNYHLNKEDQNQQPEVDANVTICPSKNVEIVTATPVPDIKTAAAAVKSVAQQAARYGYNKKTLLGPDATVLSYAAYLTCPNLKGFYNIGHGSPDGILLEDGVLTNQIISGILKNRLHEKVVVVFNSCEVFQDPLKGSVIDDADVQKYMGGITNLYIGPSELASRCFWDAALLQYDLTPAIDYCNKRFDSEDQWGIGGKGVDVLSYPQH